MRNLLICLIAAFLGSLHVSYAEVDQALEQEVKVTCPSTNSALKAHDIKFKLPGLVTFAVGGDWQVVAPFSASIGKQDFGGSSNDAIIVREPNLILTAGVVRSRPAIRLVVSNKLLCNRDNKISLLFRIRDRSEERIRLVFVPSSIGRTVATKSEKTAALDTIENIFGSKLHYIMSPEQRWLSDYLKAVGNKDLRRRFSRRFCDACSWPAQERLAEGLSEFFDAYPLLMSEPTFVSNLVKVSFAPAGLVSCPKDIYGHDEADRAYGFREAYAFNLGPSNEQSSSIGPQLDDGLVRISPKGHPTSFIEFVARRSFPFGVMGLEEVSVGGDVWDRCV